MFKKIKEPPQRARTIDFIHHEAQAICKSGILPAESLAIINEYARCANTGSPEQNKIGDHLLDFYRQQHGINDRPFIALSAKVLECPYKYLGQLSFSDYSAALNFHDALEVYRDFYNSQVELVQSALKNPELFLSLSESDINPETLAVHTCYMIGSMRDKQENLPANLAQRCTDLIQSKYLSSKEYFVEYLRSQFSEEGVFNLAQTLEIVSEHRRSMAMVLNESDKENFGRMRPDALLVTPMLKEACLKYTDTLKSWVGDIKDYDFADNWRFAEACNRGVVKGRIIRGILPDQREVNLTQVLVAYTPAPSTRFEGLFGKELPAACLLHPDCKQCGANIIALNSLYAEIQRRNDWRAEELFEKVGRLHWWLSHSPLWIRGSAAIFEMLTEALLQSKGYYIKYTGKGQIDLDAISTPNVDDFSRAYSSYFEIQYHPIVDSSLTTEKPLQSSPPKPT